MTAKFIFKTSAERSKHMAKIKSKDSGSEIALRKRLWHLGIRYRINKNEMFGCPDIAFKKYKVVVFIDGEFWHGYDWENKKQKIKSNSEYWIPKIERNMKRDHDVNAYYSKKGWNVIRFWDKEVKKNLEYCVELILNSLK
ncbi:MAG: very short patch repair endonuclease [Mucilaginibacter sp.]